MTLSSQEQSCMDRMAMLVQEAPDKIVAYTPMVHAENRGLVRSALQKYIRRGRYEQALRMAAYMKGPTSKELNYLWFSLQVCSIEDVSFGDPEAVGLALYGSLSTIRDKFGGDAVLSGVIQRLCQAPKSRACAEVSLHGDIYQLDRFKEMGDWSKQKLLDTVLQQGKPDTNPQVTQDAYMAHLYGPAARCKSKMMIWRSWSCASVSGPLMEPLNSWPSWISARVRSHSRLGPEGHMGHLITNALARPFLHLHFLTRRPRRESQLLLSGSA
jgi:hypothetical protein